MAMLQEQLADVVEEINRWDDRHRDLIERQRVASLNYLANPRSKAVLAEKRAVAALIGPYQRHRNDLAAQGRALEEAIRRERLAPAAAAPRPAELRAADEARHLATLNTLLDDAASAPKVIQAGNHTRTIRRRAVTFTCAQCGATTTELHYPGTTPRYCQTCQPAVRSTQAAERMRRMRAGQRAAADAAGVVRRPSGRPKKNN